MTQIFTDPSCENVPCSFPDIEVFYVFVGPRRPRDGAARAIARERGTAFEHCEPGWYWRACLRGSPIGPFNCEREAIEEAQLWNANPEAAAACIAARLCECVGPRHVQTHDKHQRSSEDRIWRSKVGVKAA